MKSTTKYEIFKTIEGNRDVVNQHVKKLVESIKADNLTEILPIVVNEAMEVVDGQHRLEALKILGMPVHYIILTGSDLSTVQKLNSTSKSWSLNDYVQSYVKRGNENYIVLDEYKKRFNLPLGICVALLMYGGADKKQVGEVIRNGDFKANYPGVAEALGTYISEIRKHTNKRLMQDRDFLTACIKALKSDVNRKQLIHKLSLFGMTLQKQLTVTDYLRELERLYNFRNKGERVRLF